MESPEPCPVCPFSCCAHCAGSLAVSVSPREELGQHWGALAAGIAGRAQLSPAREPGEPHCGLAVSCAALCGCFRVQLCSHTALQC